jgi:isocitrate dehydrogenase
MDVAYQNYLMAQSTPITVAYGDGIGPEIMEATLGILRSAGAALELQTIEIGEKVYKRGNTSGIDPGAWDSLLNTRVFLKAPITTPQGGGMKSLNVTVRKTLGLYANVRPTISYFPFVATKHPKMNLVIVRENEEDLYAGIEHQQTPDVAQCLKLISRPGSEKIVRYAFEYAVRNNRKKVTCITKDNIMKLTDGLFHKVFNEIALEYPEIQNDHLIVDIGAARIADTPEIFDVIVTLNLYGDIISDIAAQLAGSIGLAGSSNIGEHCAMFEAIHGSAPMIAGQNIANPSGLLNGAIMMLVHIGQPEIASAVHNAWLTTIEDGIHTGDIYHEGSSKRKVGTKEFAAAVIERLGKKPKTLKAIEYKKDVPATSPRKQATKPKEPVKAVVGVDIFFTGQDLQPNSIGPLMKQFGDGKFSLSMISNRGVKVWPNGFSETFFSDHWRARYLAVGNSASTSMKEILVLMEAINDTGIDVIKMETLCTFDGVSGFSLDQGQ